MGVDAVRPGAAATTQIEAADDDWLQYKEVVKG